MPRRARGSTLVVTMVVTMSMIPSALGALDRGRMVDRWMDAARARGGVDLARGVRPRSMDLARSVTGERHGLETDAAPVERGEAYARVAWNETLHPSRYSTSDERGLGGVLSTMRSEYGEDEKTALLLCLLYERFELGTESAFRSYFRTMPEEFETPAHWSPETVKELAGSDVYERDIMEEFETVKKVWGALKKRVFDVHTDVFKKGAAKTLYAFRWAWAVVHARATRISGKSGLALVPVIEMIRECADTGDDGDVDDEGAEDGVDDAFAVYDPHADEVVVYAKRDYAPREEICERYGGWNNGEAVQHVGYLPNVHENSARNCVLLILEPDVRYVEKVRRAGYSVPFRVCMSFSATESSLDAFAAYAELADGREVDIGPGGIPRNVSKAAAKRILEERLNRYPTTADQDAAALSTIQNAVNDFSRALKNEDLAVFERAQIEMKLRQSRHGELAVGLRIREKRILRALIEKLSHAAREDVHDEL